MTNGEQQQPAKKEKGFNMADLTKWIGPGIFLVVAGYGVYAYLNKLWPFDGSIMLPSLGGPMTQDMMAADMMTSDMMTSTPDVAGNISMIKRQIQSNISSGQHVSPSMIQAQIQAQIAAAKAKAAAQRQAILAKFPTAPKHTMIMIPGM